MENYIPNRTIDEVLDIETGKIVTSQSFFCQPDEVLIPLRRRQQEAIEGFCEPKYVCAYCHQVVRISGKPTKRGVVSYFAHIKDSDDCQIKTSSGCTKDEIEALKYAGIRESHRHIVLKEKIYKALVSGNSYEQGISNPIIEGTKKSEYPLLNWRRPDVACSFQGKEVVFELQLSTTFLSVIVARDVFYRFNKTYILWIFNFDENEKYVNIDNLMCKDILYANNRNYFIFDKEAQRQSEEKQELVLLCNWFEPKISGEKVESTKCSRYIKFSDLNFDDSNYKAFYFDSAKAFAKYSSGAESFDKYTDKRNLSYFVNLELLLIRQYRKRLYDKLAKQNVDFKQQRDEIISNLKAGLCRSNKVHGDNKWGLEVNGFLFVPFIYDKIDDLKTGYSIVAINGYYGLINQCGEEVIPCIYTMVKHCVSNKFYVSIDYEGHIFIIKDGVISSKEKLLDSGREHLVGDLYLKKEKIVDGEQKVIKASRYLKFKSISVEKDVVIAEEQDNTKYLVRYLPNGTTEISVLKLTENGKYFKKESGFWHYVNEKGITITKYQYEQIGSYINGLCAVKRNGKYGFIDEQGDESILPFYDKISPVAPFYYLYKIVGEQERLDIDYNGFITNSIYFKDDSLLVTKDGLNGYINSQGVELIPCSYKYIIGRISNENIVVKDGLYGCVNRTNGEIVPIMYQSLIKSGSGYFLAKKNDLWGCIDAGNNILIPFTYEWMGMMSKDLIMVKFQGKYGCINETGNLVIDCKYDVLKRFYEGKTIINTLEGGKKVYGLARFIIGNIRGYVDKRGNEYFQHWEEEERKKISG